MKSLANWTWHVSNTFKRKLFFHILEVYENLWLHTASCNKLAHSVYTPTNKKFYSFRRIFWFKGEMCFWEESLNSHKLKWFHYLFDLLGLIENLMSCTNNIVKKRKSIFILKLYRILTWRYFLHCYYICRIINKLNGC